jgi:hypothetical protein
MPFRPWIGGLFRGSGDGPMPFTIPAELDVVDACALRVRAAFPLQAARHNEEVLIDLAGLAAVPAGIVRWLLLQAMPEHAPLATRLSLWNAVIEGPINLAEADLKVSPSFVGCQIDVLDLTDAKVRGVEVIGGQIGCVRADRLTAAGTVLLRGDREDPTRNRYSALMPANVSQTIAVAKGVLLSGATIRGNLDLRGAVIGPLAGQDDPICVLADGLKVEGNFLAADGFCGEGEIRLNGCFVGRTMDFAAARLINPGGFTLSAIGSEVKGTLWLGKGADDMRFSSQGTIQLQRARVGGDLHASGGRFEATGWDQRLPQADGSGDDEAILADEVKVGGSVRFDDGFEAFGLVRLVSAQIGGELLCRNARFDFPGEAAFVADGMAVSGTVEFCRSVTTGLIRFELATIKQGCSFDSMIFDSDGAYLGKTSFPPLVGNVSGLHAASLVVSGGLGWSNISRRSAGGNVGPQARVVGGRTTWLSLPSAAIDVLDDDETSWQHVDRIKLEGSTVSSIKHLSLSPKWRLARLDREYAPWTRDIPDWLFAPRRWWLEFQILVLSVFRWFGRESTGGLAAEIDRFDPGPYLQLARILRAAGFPTGAEDTMLRLERNRTRFSSFSPLRIFGRWIFDFVLRYGQRPFRPLWLLFFWWLGSGALFKWLHDGQKTHQFIAVMNPADPSKPPHSFEWAQYALDTLLPFVSLGQKSNFVITPLASFFGFLPVINAFIGYALLAFLAAGLGGLIRSGKDA